MPGSEVEDAAGLDWTAIRLLTRILYSLRGVGLEPYSGPRRAERAKRRWQPAKGSSPSLASSRDIKGRPLAGSSYFKYLSRCMFLIGPPEDIDTADRHDGTSTKLPQRKEHCGLCDLCGYTVFVFLMAIAAGHAGSRADDAARQCGAALPQVQAVTHPGI